MKVSKDNLFAGAKGMGIGVALGALLMIQPGAQAQNNADAALEHAWFQDPIVGVWNTNVNITNCASGDTILSGEVLALFSADGTRHETSTSDPKLRTPSYGNWRHLEGNEYEFEFKYYRFDSNGTNMGSQVIRHDLILSADGTSYFSEGTAEIIDTFGNLLFVGCSNALATRFE